MEPNEEIQELRAIAAQALRLCRNLAEEELVAWDWSLAGLEPGEDGDLGVMRRRILIAARKFGFYAGEGTDED